MSNSATRSGRMVKMKDRSDAENVDRNTDNGSHTKSLSMTSTYTGRTRKRISMEEKSQKNDADVKNQQGVIRDATLKKSALPASPARGRVAKPDNRAIIDAETTKSKVESTVSEIKEVRTEIDREATTPSSAVRRSGRAPVPSSRYRDMELDLSRSKKRVNPTTEESEAEFERAKKIRKTSDKAATDIKEVWTKPVNNTSTDQLSEVHSVTVVLEDDNIPLSVADMIQSNLAEADLQEDRETLKNMSESVEIQIAVVSEQSTTEQSSLSRPIQAAELSVEAVEDMAPAFPSIRISGQQLTFTERDGETVAIVTIPASSVKEQAIQEHENIDVSAQEQGMGSSLETANAEKRKKVFSDLVTVSPTIHNLGHVVKRDMLETPFATVVGQDGATYLNMSVEATKISSILKGKPVATVKSNNPLKGHGRVLRNPVGSMIVKTTLVPPRMPQQDASEVKPSMTFSLLCPKKPQVGECTYSVPRTAMAPQVNQSPQRIVIRQQQPQQSTLATVSHVAPTKPSENTLTVINLSHELSNNNIPDSSFSADDSKTPKTASEILLQRLKLQSKLVIMKEPNQAHDNIVQESTSSGNTNTAEMSGNVDDIQTAPQIISESAEHMDTPLISHCEMVEKSHCAPPQDVEDDSKTETSNVDSNRDFNIIAVKVETQDDDLPKDLNVLCEPPHVAHEEDIAVSPVVQQTSQNLTEKCDTSEEGTVVSANNDSPEMPSTSSTLSELKNMDPKDMKTGISEETTSESGSNEQNVITKIVNLSGDMSTLTPAPGNKDNNKFIENIRVVDNGVEYDVRIVSEDDVAEEIIDNATSQLLENDVKQSDVVTAEVEPEIAIKQEMVDDPKPDVEKQTSGTQTVYSPQVESTTTMAGTSATTTHTLTTVVDEGSEKKHVYYVSVIPNKGIMLKTKTSMSQYSSAASWVIDDNGMYCCEKCDYQTDRKANFYKHRRSHTGAKPHVCTVCQYKAGTSSNLKRHMGIHRDIREHKCDICSLCFRQKIHLERHIKYKHEEKSIKCSMCDYICANEQPDLKMHIKRKHSTENSGEMVTCPECKTQVGNRKDLKQHMKFHRDGPELKLFCKECSFVTDCQSRLKRHTAIHSKMKPFQCGVCNYRAAQKEHVLRHLRTQHKIDIKRDGKRPWRRHKKSMLEDGSKERADFTSGDKIFACNHCAMRFAKLINLYKHLHTQHGDIMPTETDGNFYCVVCEFSTTNKKNLLVHMRRHNMTDQTPPTHVYSCVLCRYVNPRRRNLFQHMRKKHNINISRQTDNMDGDDDGEGQEMEVSDIIGSVNRTLTPNSNTTVSVTTTEASENLSREAAGDLTSVASVIKIEDLTRMTNNGENDDVQALVIDSREADITEVVHTTAHTADALEGLQALAEQAGLIDNIIEEQVPVMDEQQTVVIEQNGSTTEVVGTVETVGDQLQHLIQSAESLASTTGEVTEGLELSEEQLSSLRNGDMVEIEGHLYLVELTQDPSSPHKQVLSFLPVTTASISQDT